MFKDFENTNTTELLNMLNKYETIKEYNTNVFTTECLKLTNEKLTKKQIFLQKVENKSMETKIKILYSLINTIKKELTKRKYIL
jgi:hypothetical protein